MPSSDEESLRDFTIAENIGVLGTVLINDLEWLGERMLVSQSDEERLAYWGAFERYYDALPYKYNYGRLYNTYRMGQLAVVITLATTTSAATNAASSSESRVQDTKFSKRKGVDDLSISTILPALGLESNKQLVDWEPKHWENLSTIIDDIVHNLLRKDAICVPWATNNGSKPLPSNKAVRHDTSTPSKRDTRAQTAAASAADQDEFMQTQDFPNSEGSELTKNTSSSKSEGKKGGQDDESNNTFCAPNQTQDAVRKEYKTFTTKVTKLKKFLRLHKQVSTFRSALWEQLQSKDPKVNKHPPTLDESVIKEFWEMIDQEEDEHIKGTFEFMFKDIPSGSNDDTDKKRKTTTVASQTDKIPTLKPISELYDLFNDVPLSLGQLKARMNNLINAWVYKTFDRRPLLASVYTDPDASLPALDEDENVAPETPSGNASNIKIENVPKQLDESRQTDKASLGRGPLVSPRTPGRTKHRRLKTRRRRDQPEISESLDVLNRRRDELGQLGEDPLAESEVVAARAVSGAKRKIYCSAQSQALMPTPVGKNDHIRKLSHEGRGSVPSPQMYKKKKTSTRLEFNNSDLEQSDEDRAWDHVQHSNVQSARTSIDPQDSQNGTGNNPKQLSGLPPTPAKRIAETRSHKSRHSQKKNYEGRRKWTDEEKLAIREGVREKGIGKWAEIKQLFLRSLKDRTSGQIKDCYRTMLKRGEV